MNLETKHAQAIINLLEDAQDVGMSYVVWKIDPDRSLQPNDLDLFDTLGDALDNWERRAGLDYSGAGEQPVFYRHIDQLLEEIKQANSLTINNPQMNLNNLQDLQNEVRNLGFSAKTAEQLETNMRTQAPYFTLKEQMPGDNGLPVDMTLHFRKSNESQFYSFNKFEAVAGKIPPAPEMQHYMVLTENKEHPEKPLVKEFQSGQEAVEFFKKQKGTSELAIGESPDSRKLLASKENGQDNFVDNDFRQAFYGSAVKQNFYVKERAGFSATQAANLVQHRTVHRDNMLNPNSGESYKAWISLDFDQPKDDYGNYRLKQMNDPKFGFNLEKTLDNFKIKELADPAKKEEIMAAMRDGNRVQVTITGKDNKEHQVQVEAVPRYKTMDFYNSQGDKMKREPYLKPATNLDLGKEKGKAKEHAKAEDQGITI
ncbi:MAG TPA: hypothetical protein VIM55_10365 [Mucilaginibacter sp.]